MNAYGFSDILTSACGLARWIFRLSGAGLLAMVFTTGGCLSRPPLHRQTFAFNVPALPDTNGAAGDNVLGIKTLQIVPPFDGRSLIYRTGEFSYARDPYAEFLGPPAEGLLAPVCGILYETGAFRAVVEAGSAVKPDTLVEIRINQLYGDIRKRGSPCAVLAMRMTFINAASGLPGSVVLQRSYSRRVPMSSASAAALMAGWNRALVGILADAASDFRRKERETRKPEPRAGSFSRKMIRPCMSSSIPSVVLSEGGQCRHKENRPDEIL